MGESARLKDAQRFLVTRLIQETEQSVRPIDVSRPDIVAATTGRRAAQSLQGTRHALGRRCPRTRREGEKIVAVEHVSVQPHRVAGIVGADEALARIEISSRGDRDLGMAETAARGLAQRNAGCSGRLLVEPIDAAFGEAFAPKVGRTADRDRQPLAIPAGPSRPEIERQIELARARE